MKKLSLLPMLLLLLQGAFAVQTDYTYVFNNNLQGSNGAPDLTASCSPAYVMHTFPVFGNVSRPVFHFSNNCGVTFHDAGNFLSTGSFSIEMYVAFDSGGLKHIKLIDYKDLTTDEGLYDVQGAVNFRGPGNVSSTYFADHVFTFVVITRDAVTGIVKMYANGEYIDQFDDSSNQYAVYDAAKLLHFFMDDTFTGGSESSPGDLAMLRIFNYTLDSATAVAHYAVLNYVLSAPVISGNAGMMVYPVPATDGIYVDLKGAPAVYYEIVDLTGRATPYQGLLYEDQNYLSLADLSAGLYLIRLYNTLGETVTRKLVKQ